MSKLKSVDSAPAGPVQFVSDCLMRANALLPALCIAIATLCDGCASIYGTLPTDKPPTPSGLVRAGAARNVHYPSTRLSHGRTFHSWRDLTRALVAPLCEEHLFGSAGWDQGRFRVN